MTWAILCLLVLGSGLALFATAAHRRELARMHATMRERERALRSGDEAARLQHPVIDLSRCLGCAVCVAVCPEDGVLEIVHGQAVVVNGARCQGISACERECPAGAITVSIANLDRRDDVPALSDELEAVGADGIFLAGEVTAHALIRTAVDHGARVARSVAARLAAANSARASRSDVVDLCIVGAGPAGLACALEARRLGLSFVVLEQEREIGGTVAKYPRRKLVLTEPVELPLVGRLRRRSYEKEELIELWRKAVADHRLAIETDAVFSGIDREADGTSAVKTTRAVFRARFVCLALGRRGVPVRLGVPGEDLPKVCYALTDAASYQGRRILVVGGGDSAIETALGLSEQTDNEVTLAYRKESFVRIRSRNEERLRAAVAAGAICVIYRAVVCSIEVGEVELQIGDAETRRLPNDDVFVMAGGTPPIEALRRSGVSFDPSLRPPPREELAVRPSVTPALAIALVLTVVALGFAAWHADYYGLSTEARPVHDKHPLLRPGLGLGLAFGIASCALVLMNLAYLLRRARRMRVQFGTLASWMTSHVVTGILAFVCAVLHSAMAPRDTPGGNALWAMLVLLVTGAIGRWLYAFVPRAANGRELALENVKSRLRELSPAGAALSFGGRARAEVEALIHKRQWGSSFLRRVVSFVGLQFELRATLRRLAHDGAAAGVDRTEIRGALALAREAHREALAVAHLEDLRAVLSTWRWLHRWGAVLLVVLIAVHVGYALLYGSALSERVRP